MRYTHTIGFRLIASVVITSALALFLLSIIVSNKMDSGLKFQSDELGRMSQELLLKQLYGDAHLARDDLDELFSRVVRDTIAIAQRQTTMKAVYTGNDVAVSESLKGGMRNSDLDYAIAINDKGRVIGTNSNINFFSLNEAIDESIFSQHIFPIINDNSRSKPVSHSGFYSLSQNLTKLLGYIENESLAFVSIHPVFDDFGETTGGIIGLRVIKASENTLLKFARLSKTDVFVIRDKQIISRTDEKMITNLKVRLSHTIPGEPNEAVVLDAPGDLYVGSCAKYKEKYGVCVVVNSAQVTTLRDELISSGREQTDKIQLIIYLVAALTTITLAFVLYFVIRRTMYGLTELSIAANDVAKGSLNVPFKPKGYGEIKELSVAFDRMLRNLRVSTGKVQQLAYYCPVTGLANREKLQEDAKRLFKNSLPGHLQVMIMIDLKRFKSINDNYGMRAGDFVLRKTGERLTHIFNFFGQHNRVEKVTISRTNGDVFVVIFNTKAGRDQISKLANIIISSLAKPLRIGSSNVIIDTNLGINFYPTDGKTFEELVLHAQLALDSIDKKGAANFAFFEETMAKTAHEKQETETELREAIAQKKLKVYYQPKIDLNSGRIRGGEALVRWIHPVKGFISPAKFIPVAESAGMIGDIGRFVMERSVEETKILIDEGHDVSVAVNVSALQLEDPSFADEVLALIESKNFPAASLELEITESMAMSDPEGVKERISKLREKGIRFSMDDFGTGYSNLSQLATMPIDVLKLDRSLIMNVDKDTNKQALARSILELAADFGFKTVVEGVENAGELAFCVDNDADMVQGFVFSGAQPLEKYRPLLLQTDEGRVQFSDRFDSIGGTRDEREMDSIKHIKSPKTDDVLTSAM